MSKIVCVKCGLVIIDIQQHAKWCEGRGFKHVSVAAVLSLEADLTRVTEERDKARELRNILRERLELVSAPMPQNGFFATRANGNKVLCVPYDVAEGIALTRERAEGALQEMAKVLVYECATKHLLHPCDPGVNADYTVSVSLGVGEIRKVCEAAGIKWQPEVMDHEG